MKYIFIGLVFASAAMLSESFKLAPVVPTQDHAVLNMTLEELSSHLFDLRDKAKKEMDKLDAQNRTDLGIDLQDIAERLDDLAERLEDLDPANDTGTFIMVRALVVENELKLDVEILKIEADLVKSPLLEHIVDLRGEAEKVLERLQHENKTALGHDLRNISIHLLDIQTRLEKVEEPASDKGKATLEQLEKETKDTEKELEEELKKLKDKLDAGAAKHGKLYQSVDYLKNKLKDLKNSIQKKFKQLFG